jgi:tetratricopeptide (TPR) repeat protein
MVVAAAFAVLLAAACKEEVEPGADLDARAKVLYDEGDYDGAVQLYDALLAEYPAWAAENKVAETRNGARAKALFTAARKAARSGRYEDAGDALREAYTLAPDDAEVNYGIGWVYMEKAVQYQTKAQMMPGPGRADYILLADADAELARERFERSMELEPEYWGGYRGMAVYYMYSGDTDKAMEAVDKAEKYSKKAEDKIAAARLRIRAYIAKDDLTKAKEAIDRLVKEYPDSGETYFALGEYYLMQEKPDPEEATKAFEVGITKRFDDEGTQNQMYIMLSRLRMGKGDFDGALSATKAALANDPFNEVFTDEYAVAWGAKKLSERKQ